MAHAVAHTSSRTTHFNASRLLLPLSTLLPPQKAKRWNNRPLSPYHLCHTTVYGYPRNRKLMRAYWRDKSQNLIQILPSLYLIPSFNFPPSGVSLDTSIGSSFFLATQYFCPLAPPPLFWFTPVPAALFRSLDSSITPTTHDKERIG